MVSHRVELGLKRRRKIQVLRPLLSSQAAKLFGSVDVYIMKLPEQSTSLQGTEAAEGVHGIEKNAGGAPGVWGVCVGQRREQAQRQADDGES
jgi:hypothetical protein